MNKGAACLLAFILAAQAAIPAQAGEFGKETGAAEAADETQMLDLLEYGGIDSESFDSVVLYMEENDMGGGALVPSIWNIM